MILPVVLGLFEPLPFLKPACCPDIQPFLSQMKYIRADIIFSRSLPTHEVRLIGLKDPKSDGGLLAFRRGIMLALRQT